MMRAPFTQYRRRLATRRPRALQALASVVVWLACAAVVPAAEGDVDVHLFDLEIERALSAGDHRRPGATGTQAVELEAQIPLRVRSGVCTGDSIRLHLVTDDRRELPEVRGTVSWISPVPEMVGRKVVHEATIEVDRDTLRAIAPDLFRATDSHRGASLWTRLLDTVRSAVAALGGR